jgi:mRNA interferase RelE/StbE
LEAEDDVAVLSAVVRKRVFEKTAWLQDNFDMITPIPLSNVWRGFFKLRVGDFRVIYKIEWDRNEIFVVLVRHRAEVYKTKRR